PCLRRRHAVEARRVREVLLRGHLLEEARLDGDAVDEAPDGACLAERVVTEDARLSAVLEEERGEQADKRRLPGAVLAEDGDALAAFDREGDLLKRGHTAAREAPRLRITPAEDLRQVVDLDRRHVVTDGLGHRYGCCEGGHAAPCETRWIRRTTDRRRRRCADLTVAALDHSAAEAADRGRVHHVTEQHGAR